MKTECKIGAVLVLMCCAVIARASDRVIVIDRTGRDPKNTGLFVGPQGAVGATSGFNRPVIFADDWREYKGELYNLALKKRFYADPTWAAQIERGGVKGNDLLPGWEMVYGKLLSIENERAAFETKEGVKWIDGFADRSVRVGQTVRVYAHVSGPGTYEYGRAMSAGEAQGILNAKNAKGAKTNAVEMVSRGGAEIAEKK